LSNLLHTLTYQSATGEWWLICRRCYLIISRAEHEADLGDWEHDCNLQDRKANLAKLG
jgi:hypothetical protein